MAPGLTNQDEQSTYEAWKDSDDIRMLRDKPIHANRHLRVISIGAGPAGIFLAYKMQRMFTDFTLHVFEKNEDVGGTWFENKCESNSSSRSYY